MTRERLEEIDDELSVIISCLYQRSENEMAFTLGKDIMELWNYIKELEGK